MPHQLIICEKPSAAQKIAYALAEGRVRRVGSRWVPAYRIERDGKTITVVSALGHLYSLDQLTPGWSFPIFNLNWVPIHEVERRAKRTKMWINAIGRFAKEADLFVSACDYDTEGSLIAYMILKHTCNGADANATRMKFSTLTRADLQEAYRTMTCTLDFPVIEAGRTRHELDWLFGVNVSRALMDSHSRSGGGFEVLSAGRVQSPTLFALFKRENAVNLHVPDPFWVIGAEVEVPPEAGQAEASEGRRFPAFYKDLRILSKAKADSVVTRCDGKIGTVTDLKDKEMVIPPPVPFDLGALQLEAFRAFGFSPSKTQKVAERLYLDALISYPRTSSQKLPPSLNLGGILASLGRSREYGELVEEIIRARGNNPRPREGSKTDPAHPAIHPTGNLPLGRLAKDDACIFDLVVKRFLSAFGEAARKRLGLIRIDCGAGDLFFMKGELVTERGWTRLYSPYAYLKEIPLPAVSLGDRVNLRRVWADERYTAPPPRFTPSSILRFMERNGLGTKATRADILDTLYRRGYIRGGRIEVGELGFGVIRLLRKFFPDLTSIELTRKLETEMEGIEGGTLKPGEVMVEALDEARKVYGKIIEQYGEVGEGLSMVVGLLKESRRTIGACPKCGAGRLMVIYSRKTGKRFIGCSGYSSGCRFSLPLPQRGTISPSAEKCKACGYPMVEVRGLGPKVWRLCINVECDSKKK